LLLESVRFVGVAIAPFESAAFPARDEMRTWKNSSREEFGEP
jgi:hypothetical protein